MNIYVANFDDSFLAKLTALSYAESLEVFTNPIVYLHNLQQECPAAISNVKTVTASLLNVAMAYNETLETVQLVMFLKLAEATRNFTAFAVLANDVYRSRSTRGFARGLCASLMDLQLKEFPLNVIAVPKDSRDGRLLVSSFSALVYDDLI